MLLVRRAGRVGSIGPRHDPSSTCAAVSGIHLVRAPLTPREKPRRTDAAAPAVMFYARCRLRAGHHPTTITTRHTDTAPARMCGVHNCPPSTLALSRVPVMGAVSRVLSPLA